MMTRLESKLAQIHVALTGPTRQQVLQLRMTRLESKLAQTRVVLTGSTKQQVLQLMMTIFKPKTVKFLVKSSSTCLQRLCLFLWYTTEMLQRRNCTKVKHQRTPSGNSEQHGFARARIGDLSRVKRT